MHHAALNRAGPHNSHLDHQVVKAAWFEARQHAHLRPAFDLKHAHRVSLANHVVGLAVARFDLMHLQMPAAPLVDQLKAAAYGRQHAKCQHIDFQESHGVQVVFVPLNDAARLHACRLDRHQAGQLALREHKAADMLAQMPRKAQQLGRQVKPLQNSASVFGSA